MLALYRIAMIQSEIQDSFRLLSKGIEETQLSCDSPLRKWIFKLSKVANSPEYVCHNHTELYNAEEIEDQLDVLCSAKLTILESNSIRA